MAEEGPGSSAEALIDEAWAQLEQGNGSVAVTAARRALTIDGEAIDAFVILAQCATAPAERIALLREGVSVGRKTLADRLREPDPENFWVDHRTRPYMRAVHSLGLELWERNRGADRAQAADLARHLLDINPEDNQGVRFLLMYWLPVLGRWRGLAQVMGEISVEERRTATLYSRALSAYQRRAGAAAVWLDNGRMENPHVLTLLARGRPPRPEGDAFVHGSLKEAQDYAHHAHAAWAACPGALDWIAMGLPKFRNRATGHDDFAKRLLSREGTLPADFDLDPDPERSTGVSLMEQTPNQDTAAAIAEADEILRSRRTDY